MLPNSYYFGLIIRNFEKLKPFKILWNFWECHIFQYLTGISDLTWSWSVSRLTQISQHLTEDEHRFWGSHWDGLPRLMIYQSHGDGGFFFLINLMPSCSFGQFDGTGNVGMREIRCRWPSHNHSCSKFKIPPSPASSSFSSPSPSSPWERTSCFTSWNTSIFTWQDNKKVE